MSSLSDLTIDVGAICFRYGSHCCIVPAFLQNVICPDRKSVCPDNFTCCVNINEHYGCCPTPKAVCCSDKLHCCPNGYKCSTASGTCTKSVLTHPLLELIITLEDVVELPPQPSVIKLSHVVDILAVSCDHALYRHVCKLIAAINYWLVKRALAEVLDGKLGNAVHSLFSCL